MRWKWLILLLIYALSVAVRIYPAFVTSIPYNVDALLDARASQYIGDHGTLAFPQNVNFNNYHTPVTPVFNALCGAISQLTGLPVLSFLPYVYPFLTAVSVLGWYLVAKKITRREEVGVMVALFFALSGTYVLQTSLVWKEAVGYIIMPFAIYTYRRRNTLSLMLLAILPLVHHYVALITYILFTYLILYQIYLRHREHQPLDSEDKFWSSALLPLWIYFSLYYTLRHFDRLNELSTTGGLWLFISLFTVLYLLGIKLLSTRYNKYRITHILILLAIPLALYVTYFFYPVFPHTMQFNLVTLIFTLGYFLLLPISGVGMYILLTTKYEGRTAYLSTLLAPLQMLLFFFLRGLDVVSYASISRTVDFADPPVAMALAAGSYKKKVAMVAVIFVVVASTTPLAYTTGEAFGVHFFIYPQEYHAAQWINEHWNSSIATDDKLGLVAHNGFNITANRGLPLLLKNNETPPEKLWLVGDYWREGAQLSPMAPVPVNVSRILTENSVLYSSGSTFVVLNNTSK